MKIFSIFAACLGTTALAGDVLNAGPSDFESKIKPADLALVKFFAPWCGHCKKMAPDYEKAATVLKENDPPVLLAEVDCTVHQDLCGNYGVSGYPTLKVFRNGEASDYNGGRSYGDFVKMMAGQAGPASAEILETSKIEKLINGKTNIVIGFFENEKSEGLDVFKKAANELRETNKFAHTFSADVAKAAGQELGSIVLFRPKALKSKFEEQEVKYVKEKFTTGLIRNWVKEVGPGLAPVIQPQDQETMGFPQVIAIFNVDYERDAKGTQYWRNRVMKVAVNFPDMNFAVAGKDVWGGFLNELGVQISKAPIVVIFGDKGTKYLMTSEFDPKGEAFTQFLLDFNAGKVAKHTKSEAEPASQGANKKFTANNFESLVDGTKDAFIKFYAPWCGHCKTLAPKWEELAEKMESKDSLVIGDFDATANDVPPQFEVSGFPTMYWVPKGKLNAPVKYQSGREVKDFIAFVKENASDQNLRDEL